MIYRVVVMRFTLSDLKWTPRLQLFGSLNDIADKMIIIVLRNKKQTIKIKFDTKFVLWAHKLLLYIILLGVAASNNLLCK